MEFTIGADVEVFAKQGDNHKALCGLIGGTKEKPKQLEQLPLGFCVQEDNVSLEFNIPPAKTKKEFIEEISLIRKEVESLLSSMQMKISKNAAVSFDSLELQHPQALLFGCEPDYNIWTMCENEKPSAEDVNLRTAGGHIHVGIQGDGIDVIKITRALDLFLGVPSILLDDSSSALERRKLYGKAGAMRPKPYGLEYRVLSNFWIFKENLVAWIYDGVKQAIEYNKKLNSFSMEIQKCINTGDKNAAERITKAFGLTIPY